MCYKVGCDISGSPDSLRAGTTFPNYHLVPVRLNYHLDIIVKIKDGRPGTILDNLGSDFIGNYYASSEEL